MGSPPIFEDFRGWRWSLGSTVIASWWERGAEGSAVELEREGLVVGVHKGAEGGWLAVVDFGPVASLTIPRREFSVDQIAATVPPPAVRK